jgi:anaerobic glycerol-3-phosphate dehydrogenase
MSSESTFILGQGLSSYCIALALQKKGNTPILLSSGPGATSLSSGSWDFIKTNEPVSFSELLDSERWKKSIGKILWDDSDKLSPEIIRKDLEEVVQWLDPFLEISTHWKKPALVPDSMGKLRVSYVCQKINSAADFSSLKNKKVIIPYHSSWRFFAPLIAKKLTGEAKKRDFNIDVQACKIEEAEKKIEKDISLASFSTSPANIGYLLDQVKTLKNDCDLLLFPPLWYSPSRR